MTRRNTPADLTDANCSPNELFRRSAREVTNAAREHTATPAARQSVTLETSRIDHPSPSVNAPHAFLSYLIINDPVAPIIASAEYHHGPRCPEPRELAESLLDDKPTWLTIDIVYTDYFFATGGVAETLAANSHNYIMPWRRKARATHRLRKTLRDDSDDNPPGIVTCAAEGHPGHYVFLNDRNRSSELSELEDQYDLFLTRLSHTVEEQKFRKLIRVFVGNSYVWKLLSKAVTVGFSEHHCLLYLALINYTAAETLSETSADL